MRLTFTPRCTSGATASAIERPSPPPVSKSQIVVPSATVPHRSVRRSGSRSVSRRVVLPPESVTTRTTLRISSDLRASRSCLPAARAPLPPGGHVARTTPHGTAEHGQISEPAGRACSGRRPARRLRVSAQKLAPARDCARRLEIHSPWPPHRPRTYASHVTRSHRRGRPRRAREPEPAQGTLELAAPRTGRPREWQAAAAAVPAQGAPTGRGRPGRAGLGEVYAHHVSTASASPRWALPDLASTAWSPRAAPDAHRGVGHPSDLSVGDAALDNESRYRPRGRSTVAAAEAPEDTDWSTLLDGVLLDLALVVLQTTEAGLCAFFRTTPARPACSTAHQPRPARGRRSTRARRARLETGVRVFIVDATEAHDRGASDVQGCAELAGRRRDLPAHPDGFGFDLDEAAEIVEFRDAATDDQFMTIAKLRAARRCGDGSSSSVAPGAWSSTSTRSPAGR